MEQTDVMNIYKFHSNPYELLYGEDKDRVLGKMVRHRLGYTSRFTPDLITAVVTQLGAGWGDEGEPDGLNLYDTLSDIYKHGMTGGFSGFTYYSETKEFYLKNKKEINELLEHDGLDFGYNDTWHESLNDLADVCLEGDKLGAISMVLNLRCSEYSLTEEVYTSMYDGYDSECDTTVANCISWYVVESLASEYYDIMNGEG